MSRLKAQGISLSSRGKLGICMRGKHMGGPGPSNCNTWPSCMEICQVLRCFTMVEIIYRFGGQSRRCRSGQWLLAETWFLRNYWKNLLGCRPRQVQKTGHWYATNPGLRNLFSDFCTINNFLRALASKLAPSQNEGKAIRDLFKRGERKATWQVSAFIYFFLFSNPFWERQLPSWRNIISLEQAPTVRRDGCCLGWRRHHRPLADGIDWKPEDFNLWSIVTPWLLTRLNIHCQPLFLPHPQLTKLNQPRSITSLSIASPRTWRMTDPGPRAGASLQPGSSKEKDRRSGAIGAMGPKKAPQDMLIPGGSEPKVASEGDGYHLYPFVQKAA